MQALSPLSTPQRRNTAPIRRSAPAGLQQRRIQRSNVAPPRKTDVWRTNDYVRFAFIVDAQDTSSGTIENDVKFSLQLKPTALHIHDGTQI
ncbi:hypothetical protein AVEN_34271-1 [Araneus ventricosus]|uniref:Uncharacterized protein n=1 Tax=Araneus ventricosus TaxID=182803 RepID=A0A4Y2KA52_ARAVE|nr:hypothetical protein AVEN_34271-1 [Araneus ventricosus]